jgi:anti-sigma regulatory factor (Ser/Thr protein kinase)
MNPIPGPETPPVFEKEITLSAVLNNLDRALAWLETILTNYSCPPRICHQLMIITEEIFMNITNYAYPGKTGNVTLRAGRAGEAFAVQYEDEGIPFNPLEWPSPQTDTPLEARRIGGLGIHMVRKMTDQLTYLRLPGKNQLTVRKTPEKN